jgi:predicted nucleic acid-binding protein
VTTVVSDTSPINYLILVEAIEVLPRIFDEVLIPPAVHSELQRPETPTAVAQWAANLPPWARVQAPTHIDAGLALGPGETEAISLAMELKIPAILIDEQQGRLAARSRGIDTIGTLSILDSADRQGFVDFEQMILRLRQTNFRINPSILEELLVQVRQRKSS